MTRKLCCFFCPAKDYENHELTDQCPQCHRPLGFPELSPPSHIGDFKVLRALPRGFYSATYVVESGRLRRPYVLKVVSKRMYDFFNKDFTRECEVHNAVAQGSDHVVDIIDFWDADVMYDEPLSCWVAQLEFVDGVSLRQFLDSSPRPTARAIAQVSIDLLGLLAELTAKQVFHNDLHADNILVSTLAGDARRPDQIEEHLRAVAIDLGSITDRSKTGDAGRLGDLHDVAAHLLEMADILLRETTSTTDADYRLAAKLSEVAHSFAPPAEHQRPPDYRQAVEDIRDAFAHQRSPWDVPARLRRLDEGYNAAALHPWFVPKLLVDPKGQWLARISQAGPLVITGMRGCGKTMLLRALELHARISHHRSQNPSPTEIMSGIQKDAYVGIYVSCTRLLDILDDPEHALHEPHARLFLAYAREALRALRHVREVSREAVPPGYHHEIDKAIRQVIVGAADAAPVDSESALEGHVIDMLASLERRESRYSMTMHPASAFPRLAEAIGRGVPFVASAQVLFLLDDVSTRHLNARSIADLLSALLFSHPACAFKMTTETQTLELVLRSPGLIEKAQDRRDYSPFDLGAEVNRELNGSLGGGKKFISQILQQRIALAADQFGLTPEQRLGDISLEEIARRIVQTTRESAERKNVYHGMSTLAAICVGDIGDVITLYEMMVTRAGSNPAISAEIQAKCYQEYCSRRLYNVNRRNGRLKDFALTFAAAAHQLMMRSGAKGESRGLRQYYSIYVRITGGDVKRQLDQIRELTDAGVFVLDAGADAPRSKTRDADPIHQFILTYRKLFGLSSYVGLADRDRFELSGQELQEWLENPHLGTEILMRGLTGPREKSSEITANGVRQKEAMPSGTADSGAAAPSSEPLAAQLTLESISQGPLTEGDDSAAVAADQFVDVHGPRSRDMHWEELVDHSPQCVVVGLGFEERTATSLGRILDTYRPKRVVAVRYDEPGRSDAMRAMLSDANIPMSEVPYDADALAEALRGAESMLVDVTGLAKPVLFAAVTAALRQNRRVVVAHTRATEHYPTDQDIAAVFAAEAANDPYALMASLDKLLTGEKGPYSFVRLLSTQVDDSRLRVLLASASPKHERLLSFLDERDVDILEVLHPSASTPRGRLAAFAAELALREHESGRSHVVESDDLAQALQVIGKSYYSWYIQRNASFEMALTGSKMHAVAIAAAVAAYKVSQCWYVRPAEFDPDRFTRGVADSQLIELWIP